MYRKRILVLANSIKNNERCVAGRELSSEQGECVLGPWVRPISNHGEGELRLDETMLTSGRPVRVLDFVEMPLLRNAEDPSQPENWLIAGRKRWDDVNYAYDRCSLSMFAEYPSDLWLQRGTKSDRIADDYLRAHPPPQSLYVIRPQSLRIRLFTEQYEDNERKKRRVRFRYNGLQYDLALTDPAIQEKHGWQIPDGNQAPREFPLPCADRCLICVSLAGEYRGHHYKVVATVFEDVP